MIYLRGLFSKQSEYIIFAFRDNFVKHGITGHLPYGHNQQENRRKT
jgi:hypothetical protein